ncbi:MAG: FAD-dependent tricarballylate dehydrogenase TcuA [Desulfobacterales bacterium]|jgi:tricarballylate dehydrogenase|nr:FAD-dependent tricarballylate dehydrogenase TcuA [Desulfobacterales bacterium]
MDQELSAGTDVLVIGGGAAALSAAIAAREKGARVILLECSPKHFRGGNSRHTRNMRLAHETQFAPYTGAYPEAEMWENYLKATGGEGDLELAKMVVGGSSSILAWMQTHGVRFQPALAGTLHLGRTNAWFLGGGKAMVNALFRSAERLGVQVRYDAEVVGLDVRAGRFRSAAVRIEGKTVCVPAQAVVVAAGGFQSNLAWLRQAWGPAADNFLIRGAPFDTGTLLKLLLDHGAESVGDPTQAHMVPIDARSPKFDGGIVTRLDCVTLGIVVNKNGERYYDEGEDFWPMRYAIWGRLVAQQPDQISYVFIDSKTLDRFMPSVFPPVEGRTIAEVAEKFNLPVDKVVATVEEFNRAVRPGTFDHTIQDDCRTEGLTPSKSHWALRIDEPPFYGYPLRPGLTFTYYGVKIDRNAAVIFKDGRPAANIFAAGEIMAGNILPKGYIGGIGLVIGNVFGRIAGEQAAVLSRGAERKAAV